MIRPVRPINVNSAARKVEVDNRFPIYVYYRIADNILRQANIYREEKNIVDLYIMLLRFSSLVSETIPFHRDYQTLLIKESAIFKKKLHAVLDELEYLKPKFKLCINDLNKSWSEVQNKKIDNRDASSNLTNAHSFQRPYNKKAFVTFNDNKPVVSSGDQDYWKHTERQSHKMSLSLPLPKKDTLSRHSFLGPNGLAGQWMGPVLQAKVHYPSNNDLVADENIGPSQTGENVSVQEKENYSKSMEAVLSLDDGRWTTPIEKEIYKLNVEEKTDNPLFDIVRQPSPPPIPTKLQQDSLLIPSSKVADPRPGGAPSHSQDCASNSGSYQDLHIPVKMMDEFLRLVRGNTANNLETCGVLAGSLKNRVFHITTLIIPKQESTSDSCQTLNEEEIFEAQDKFSLFPLGWIHTHPTQTCFMSSVDLHTHYSYQIMLPEAVAIVMAPSDTTSPHGIFHLSDPGGVSVIRKCQQRGFHPHEEPTDGTRIYEHCSHVFLNPSLKFDVVDLR